MKKHILIVEDEPEIQELLTAYLHNDGYQTETADDGIEALDRFHSGGFDLILLDVMLPKIDGFGVCELIRRESSIPILMLTALDGEAEQLKGYDLKIDDYITKPFSMPVLLKKIAAVLRRSGGSDTAGMILYRELVINPDTRECRLKGRPLDLTCREFELLSELVQSPGRVHTRDMLLNKIWGYDFPGDERIVDSHIKNIRKKLDNHYIETVRGVGYRVEKIS